MANANFQKLIDAQKNVAIKRKAKIAEAANEYVVDKQIELGYGPSYYKKKNISRAALNVVKDFQKDIYSIEDGGYSDFKNWITKWRSYEKTATGTRSPFDEPEKLYIKSILDPTLKVIASQGGMSLRTTYAAEAILKSLKPLNLLEIMTRRVPFINNMVQDYIAAKDAGEAMAASKFKMERQQANEERLRLKEEKELGTGEQVGGGIADAPQSAGGKIVGGLADVAGVPKGIQAAAGGLAEITSKGFKKAGELFGGKKKKQSMVSKMAGGLVGGKAKAEESKKEADTEREESQDLFRQIEENTKATAEALGVKGFGEGGQKGGLMNTIMTALGLGTGHGAGKGAMGGLKSLFKSKAFLRVIGPAGMITGAIAGAISTLLAGGIWAVVDGFRGKEKWGGTSGFMGGLLGGLDKGIMGAIKNMGKWALVGASIGTLVAPVIGTIIGGLIGLVVGALLGWIGGAAITRWIRKMSVLVSNIWTSMIDRLKETWKDTKAAIKEFPGKVTQSIKNIFVPIFETLDAIILGAKKTLNWLIDKYNFIAPGFMELDKFDVSDKSTDYMDSGISGVNNVVHPIYGKGTQMINDSASVMGSGISFPEPNNITTITDSSSKNVGNTTTFVPNNTMNQYWYKKGLVLGTTE